MVPLRIKIIELLVQKGILNPRQVEETLKLHKEQGKGILSLLFEKNYVKKDFLAEFINNNIHLPSISSVQVRITPEILALLPQETAREQHACPLSLDGNNLTVAVDNPMSIFSLAEIASLEKYSVSPVITSEAELAQLIEHHYPEAASAPVLEMSAEALSGGSMEDILDNVEELRAAEKNKEVDLSRLAQITQEVPIVKATNFILEKAIELKASDILVEPMEKGSRIRYRIDGIFHQTEMLPLNLHPFVISRIKVISNLDIAEHRLPQDGQFKMKLANREVDFRVSTFPLINGEKAAIRILDKSLGLLDVNKLGIRPEALAKLKQSALLPYGMILVTGPTGSGKTSTLYSLLKFIHSPEKNIITVEDPVEYQLKGINQVSVNAKIGLIFSRCLRAILRQDPDIIMIGEIRDFETVDIAIKAALTGHLVLSTLHTTTTSGSIIRLIDMGVEPFLINSALIAIVTQRLARRICPNCKEKIPDQPYYQGKGCDKCLKTGYGGRVLIPEMMYITPRIKEVIMSEKIDENIIKEVAREEGMKTLREEGDILARAGITSYEEVLRVTPADR